MGIVAWIILGLVAGLVAKKLVPSGDRHGLVITTVIGIAGALLGGVVATQLFDVDGVQGFFDLITWITAIAGAAALLLAFTLVTGGSGRGSRRSWASRR